jgi:hypothetical protein
MSIGAIRLEALETQIMSIISIRSNCPRLRPLGSRKRHYEPAVQSVCAAAPVRVPVPLSTVMPPLPDASVAGKDLAIDCAKGLSKSVRLLIPVVIFAAIYLYGMFDQAPSNGLTNFESNLFAYLAPLILLAVGLINVYGLWKSRRTISL